MTGVSKPDCLAQIKNFEDFPVSPVQGPLNIGGIQRVRRMEEVVDFQKMLKSKLWIGGQVFKNWILLY